MAGEGRRRGVTANPLIWLPDQIIKRTEGQSGDIAFSGFIASAICRATHPGPVRTRTTKLDGEIISVLK